MTPLTEQEAKDMLSGWRDEATLLGVVVKWEPGGLTTLGRRCRITSVADSVEVESDGDLAAFSLRMELDGPRWTYCEGHEVNSKAGRSVIGSESRYLQSEWPGSDGRYGRTVLFTVLGRVA